MKYRDFTILFKEEQNKQQTMISWKIKDTPYDYLAIKVVDNSKQLKQARAEARTEVKAFIDEFYTQRTVETVAAVKEAV